ncbi:hypothetical protein [Crocosphaera sp.]|uniref:hypothetical protein n=1 Tax=Crocosphaera sp. TaxID=2729996 RepID=UPI002639F807|nr:hypothetical protein [Crocosphaera sp.]MDJ0579227.1 hypothetical protein [Crocosphaera sp.]
MIKDLLKVADLSVTETHSPGDNDHKKLAFQLETVADRLELIMENMTTGKNLDKECLSLEQDCKKLTTYLYRETIKDRIPRYQQILTLIFASKVALSEIYFGSSLTSKFELNQDDNKKVQKNLLTVKNNSQKMKTISEVLAVS